MADQLDHREALAADAAEQGVAVPDHGGLRHMAERDRLCGGPLRRNSWTTRGDYAIHLDYIARAQESLGSALARVREVLEDDDRHLAASLAGQQEGEDTRMREERVARLLDDPEKLQELRQQRAERKTEKSERQQQSKGRYWSMRI